MLSRCSRTWETMPGSPVRGARSAGSRTCGVGTRKLFGRPRKCSSTRVARDAHGRLSSSSNTHSCTDRDPPTKACYCSMRHFREPRIPVPSLHRSLLLAMLGRFDEAWLTARESSQRAQALTGNSQAQFPAQIATLEGDHAAAVECWRDHCHLLERHGDRATLSTAAPLLGRSLCALGRYEEAAPLAQLGRELADASDIVTQALWRQVEARVLGSEGRAGEAKTLAQEAVELADRTDGLQMQGDALCDLAEVLAAVARDDEAAVALEQALERYERKKNLAMVAQVRSRLEALRVRVT